MAGDESENFPEGYKKLCCFSQKDYTGISCKRVNKAEVEHETAIVRLIP